MLFFKGWHLPFFCPCLLCSCWLFLDGYCLYLKGLAVSGHFWWHVSIRIENKNTCLYPALWMWKILHSRLPLKICMATNAWKDQSQQIFLITPVWSIVYKLEYITCKKIHRLNSLSVTVIFIRGFEDGNKIALIKLGYCSVFSVKFPCCWDLSGCHFSAELISNLNSDSSHCKKVCNISKGSWNMQKYVRHVKNQQKQCRKWDKMLLYVFR